MKPSARMTAAVYLLVQASGVIAWWVWLHGSAAGREVFAPRESEVALLSFAPGDLLLLSAVALAAAAGLLRNKPWVGPLLWLHAGAGAYASCWAGTLAVHEPTHSLGALIMIPVFIFSIGIALWFTASQRRP